LSHLTSCTPTKSNLYLANSLAAAESEPALYRLLTFHVPNLMSLFRCLAYQRINPGLRQVFLFHNTDNFYGEELSTPRPTPKLEDHPLSALRDCLFNIFAATLHIEGCFSLHNLRTCHALGTGTHFSWLIGLTQFKFPTAPVHLTSLHFTSLHFTAHLGNFHHISIPFTTPRS
jgi:hypothetical protein